jgi:hypothetical protein
MQAASLANDDKGCLRYEWYRASTPPFSAMVSSTSTGGHATRVAKQRGAYLPLRIHGLTIYSRSRNPRPSKIAGIAFSIRAVRVPDCFAPAK